MKKNTKKKIAVAAGAAAAAAGVAAGAYYLYGSKHATQNRKQLGVWADKARKEVEREVSKLKDATLNEKNYKAIVKEVSSRYKTLKTVDPKEVVAFISAVSADWKKFSAKAKKVGKNAGRVVKAAKKTAKKRS